MSAYPVFGAISGGLKVGKNGWVERRCIEHSCCSKFYYGCYCLRSLFVVDFGQSESNVAMGAALGRSPSTTMVGA